MIPSLVVILSVTKLRPGLATMTSARSMLSALIWQAPLLHRCGVPGRSARRLRGQILLLDDLLLLHAPVPFGEDQRGRQKDNQGEHRNCHRCPGFAPCLVHDREDESA